METKELEIEKLKERIIAQQEEICRLYEALTEAFRVITRKQS